MILYELRAIVRNTRRTDIKVSLLVRNMIDRKIIEFVLPAHFPLVKARIIEYLRKELKVQKEEIGIPKHIFP